MPVVYLDKKLWAIGAGIFVASMVVGILIGYHAKAGPAAVSPGGQADGQVGGSPSAVPGDGGGGGGSRSGRELGTAGFAQEQEMIAKVNGKI